MPRVHLPDGRIVNFPDAMSEGDITKAVEELSTPKSEEKSLGGFLSNIASSGGRLIKDTVTGLPAAALMGVRAQFDPNYRQQASMDIGRAMPAVLEAAKQRYGGVENIKNTAYSDPVGVLADVATVLEPAARIASAGKLTRTAAALSKAGDLANPVRMVGRVVEPITHGVANTIVRGTLRAPASVREDFGGSKAIADAVLKDRVYSEASAGRKLNRSVAQADQMLEDAQAAGVPGVPRRDVADAVLGTPRDTAKLRTRLGVPDQSGELMDTAKGIIRNNPRDIPLTEAQQLKREAQALAYEAGTDNQTVKKAAEVAKAKAFRGGIEKQVPEVGPVNEQSQRLLGSKLAFGAAEDRPRALTNFLSALGGVGGFAGGGPVGAAVAPLLIKAMDSPRAGAMTGIAMDSIGRGLSSPLSFKSALLARLLGEVPDQP